MKRDDKIYVGKILAAGFVPQIPTSTQYCHKLWLTQHCLIDHSNFLIYTPTSYKFQLFYFVWFLFYLGVGSEPHWIGDQVILPNFCCWQHSGLLFGSTQFLAHLHEHSVVCSKSHQYEHKAKVAKKPSMFWWQVVWRDVAACHPNVSTQLKLSPFTIKNVVIFGFVWLRACVNLPRVISPNRGLRDPRDHPFPSPRPGWLLVLLLEH